MSGSLCRTDVIAKWYSDFERAVGARRELLAESDAGVWLLAPLALLVPAAVSLWLAGGYHALFYPVNALATALPAPLWAHLTFLGDDRLVLGLALILAARYPRFAWPAVVAALIGTLLVHVPKDAFAALRPPAVLPEGTFNLIGPRLTTRSFPSGHSACAFTVAGVLLGFVRAWPWRAALLALAGAVAASRVVVGVHWPVDVLAGAALGLLSAWLGLAVARRWNLGRTATGYAVCLLVLGLGTVRLLRYALTDPLTGAFGMTIGIAGLAAAVVALVSPLLAVSGSGGEPAHRS